MRRQSLIDYFAQQFRAHASDTAYTEPRGYRVARWSYRQMAEAWAQFARYLESLCVGHGDRVLLWGPNSAEWVVAFLGCVFRGAVVVPMDQIASPDFALRIARQVDARLVVCARQHAGFDPARPAAALEDLSTLLAPYSRAAYASPEIRRDDIVEIVFTSGTTADPKGVVITHGNVLANLDPLEIEIRKYLKYEWLVHPLRFINLLPLSHVFGQFLGIFLPPLLGATVVFEESLNPSEIIRTIRRERVSLLVTVPRVLDSLRGKIERDLEAAGRAARFASDVRASQGQHFLRRWWRFRRIRRQFGCKFWAMVSGGAALTSDTEEFWDRLGYAVIQGYGLTETTSLVSVNHPFRLGKGSIGKVLPGREIKLDENGEILVRGESIAAGYWEGQQLRPAGEAEWFHTGDVGELDAEGNLYFKGRKKNVIVTPAGMNIYPEDLEAALRRQPDVRDCAVIGLEREGNAEPCAVLLLKQSGADAEPAVRRANDSLADFQQMRRWLVWPEQDFPRTSTGKPRLSAIRDAVASHFGAAALVASPSSTEGGSLAELIARVTGRAPAGLSPNAQLATDLNLTSLDRVELLSAIEDRYQVDLNESAFTAATSVGEIERLVAASAAHSERRSEYVYPRWAQRWPVTWLRPLIYYALTWPATWLLGTPRICGRENLRGVRGPVLVIVNHTLYLDPAFVLAALPLRLRHRLAIAIGAERLRRMRHPPREWNLFRRWLYQVNYALVVAVFNVFPLPQQSGFRESFQFAGELVDRGYSVLVFPEGELTPDGEMKDFRAGIGLLANNLNLSIVPLRIEGLYRLKQLQKRNARFGDVRVTIGEPVESAPGTDAEQIARELEARVRALGRGPDRSARAAPAKQ
jgi:long-chain acyl-CoA synthetase